MNMQTRKAKDTRSSVKLSKLGKFRMEHMPAIKEVFGALFDDFVNLNPFYRSVDSARDYKTLIKRLDSEGLGFVTHALPNLMSDIFEHLEGGKPLYTGWKLRDGIPVFLGRLIHSVRLKDDNCTVSLSQIYQICVAFKKLRGPYKPSVLSKEIEKFVEEDVRLGMINLCSEPVKEILDNARELVETVLKDIEPWGEGMKPKPGPGATNTPVGKIWRYRPHQIFTDLDEVFPYLEWFYTHSWDPVKDARRYMNLPEHADAVSRFKFVQKYLGKPRGICIEENEMQFFQQAVKRTLCAQLERHPATRGRINFTRQDINQKLALEASASGEWATLDFSSASNLIAREAVFRLTWNTNLFHQLDAVSTRLIKLPDDTLHPAHMFAPMGSGVCFPVMALVHWALIRSIIKLSSIPDSEKVSKSTYVYGDDIIIPVEAVQAVYDYLPLFGMKINPEKSFYKGEFRESCGVHAFRGVDITPVYVNRITKTRQDKKDTNVLLSLIAKEAQFFKKGYLKTSQCIQRLVEKHYWSLPTVGSTSPILGWLRDGLPKVLQLFKYARRVKYDPHLQTSILEFQTVVPRRDPWANEYLEEGDGYLRKLLTGDFEANLIKADVEDLTIGRRWFTFSGIQTSIPR